MKTIVEKITESSVNSNSIIGASLDILNLEDSLKVASIAAENVLGSEIGTVIGTEGTGYPLYNETGGADYSSTLDIKDNKKYTLLVCDEKGHGRGGSHKVYIALTPDQVDKVQQTRLITNTLVDAILDLTDSSKCSIDEIASALENIQYYITGDFKRSWASNLLSLKN